MTPTAEAQRNSWLSEADLAMLIQPSVEVDLSDVDAGLRVPGGFAAAERRPSMASAREWSVGNV